ncbi:MAG: FeoB-associated Cys-rich membrane protein [Flavobacteriaceae bacterium]
MTQDIIVYVALAVAVFFLLRKFIFKPKSKKNNGCDSDCCG